MKKLWLLAAILILALFVTACSGNNTEVAPNETPDETSNETNNEVSENNDPDTTTGSGLGTLATVEAISAQWAASGHADTGRPLNYAGGRDGCQPCHSGNGFSQFLTDNPFTPEADAEADVEEGAPVQVPMGCATCHTGAGKDMIELGIAPDGYVPFADGDYDAGTGSALCISCHNGRRDVGALYEAAAAGDIPHDYPHYDAGALFSGEGGMEYPEVSYASSEAHQSNGCTSCHMPETEDGFVSHDFGMEVEYIDATCGSCHKDATDFTVGGDLQARIDALLEELNTATLANVKETTGLDENIVIGSGHGTFPFSFADADGNILKDKEFSLDLVSKEAFVAAYNYVLMSSDKSGGAHNPKYAISLLEESLAALQ